MEYFCLLFLALLGSCCSSIPKISNAAQECEPPRGYARKICGQQTVLNRTSVPIPDFLYGPNTCRVTEEFVSNEFLYKFRNYCAWVLYGYRYHYQCTPFCMPTGTCSSTNRTLQRHNVECCDGFLPRRRSSEDISAHYEFLYDTFYVRVDPNLPDGCPIARGDDVEECMSLLGLTTFGDLYAMEIADLLDNETQRPLTFFVPVNEAFESLPAATDLALLVMNHIVNGTIGEGNLTNNGQFVALSGLRLLSTAVTFADRTLAQYSHSATGKSTQHQQPNPVRYTSERFISGAQILNPNACLSVNVTLHVIDRVLMPAEQTLAAILQSRANLSRFTEALEFANVLQFLDKPNGESRTIFAPSNTAFDERIPPDLFICLMYKRLPLSNLVLFHIVGSAEYTSSLAVHSGLHTLQGSAFRLSQNDNGEVSIATNPPASIVESNIPASNGVLHIVDDVLIPPNLDFGACSSFVTTIPTPSSSRERNP